MKLAGELGFEPRLPESESGVLPLDDSPSTGAFRSPEKGRTYVCQGATSTTRNCGNFRRFTDFQNLILSRQLQHRGARSRRLVLEIQDWYRTPGVEDVTETGDGSRSASGEADASVTDGGPAKAAASPIGFGKPDSNEEDGKPKRKRRRRRRGKRGGKNGAVTTQGAAVSPCEARQGNIPTAVEKPLASQKPQTKPVEPAVYAAIDLGTNNCRLLVAKRNREGFRVIDAYSRIVRLGEGVVRSGELSEGAMDRALEALTVCAAKMERRGVTRVRSIATEACRTARNGPAFVERVKRETGVELDIVSTADEARLAVTGCAPLLDPDHAAALVFDIGGGSTELMWVQQETPMPQSKSRALIKDWTSLPCGVVTLAETYGGGEISHNLFETMVGDVFDRLTPFHKRLSEHLASDLPYHLLGTSGTVTTIAGIHMDLKSYDRSRVDGAWVAKDEVSAVTESLLAMNLAERAAHPCVGVERADLVLAGCAILEAICRAWPADKLRVADRGLREGILFSLMEEDEANRSRRGRRRRRRRKKKTQPMVSEQPQSPDNGATN